MMAAEISDLHSLFFIDFAGIWRKMEAVLIFTQHAQIGEISPIDIVPHLDNIFSFSFVN